MIIDNDVLIKVYSRNINNLRKAGYVVKINETIKVPISFLDKNSHTNVNVKCDVCGKIKTIQYRYYNDSIKNYTNHTIENHKLIINYFIEKYSPHNIITHINLDYQNVDNFKQLNFIKFIKLKPKYYLSNNILKSNLIFNKNDEKYLFLKNKKKYKIYNSGVIKAIM